MAKQIVNIINFIRCYEPRNKEIDLLKTVENQINLFKSNNLPVTFLIQYDAMINNKFSELLIKNSDENIELGGWFEIVQPLVEKAGLAWKGRQGYSWDWHANVDFSIAYSQEDRKKLVDTFMNEFKSIFKIYPQSVGSWIIDSFTLEYMFKKYNIVASCNCRDQWGTDGYTLWGGYYNQAYYPSRRNVFTPAQSTENQINVPVFRMLGSDPIYQYDAGLIDKEGNCTRCEDQPVYTLEAAYPPTGGNPEWIKWYFEQNFNANCISFGYTQVGQENSFGWDAMRDGLEEQVKIISKMAASNQISVEKLCDTGKWYRSIYKITPASAVVALKDWQNNNCKSIWYYNRFYRVNLFNQGKHLWIRDFHIFDEYYEDRYLYSKCETENFTYDNLPMCDGNRWSKGSIRAGIYPVEICEDGKRNIIEGDNLLVDTKEEGKLEAVWNTDCGIFKFTLEDKSLLIKRIGQAPKIKWVLDFTFNEECDVPIEYIEDHSIVYNFNNYNYKVEICSGYIHRDNNLIEIKPYEDMILFKI